MADLSSSAKSLFLKAMEGISSAASNVASNTRYKINEMNLTNQRRELLEGFGAKAYELFKAGAEFPPELTEILTKVVKLDEQLNEIRTEHQNASKPEGTGKEPASDEAGEPEEAQEKAVYGETDDAVPVMDMPEIGIDEAVSAAEDAVEKTVDSAKEVLESSRETADRLTDMLDEMNSGIPAGQPKENA